MSSPEMIVTVFLCGVAGSFGAIGGFHLAALIWGPLQISVKNTTTVIQKREP